MPFLSGDGWHRPAGQLGGQQTGIAGCQAVDRKLRVPQPPITCALTTRQIRGFSGNSAIPLFASAQVE